MKKKFEFRSVFNEKSVKQTAKQIKEVYSDFQEEAFVTDVLNGFELLSFGDRNAKITDSLYHFLPNDYTEALTILVASLGDPLIEEELEGYEDLSVKEPVPDCLSLLDSIVL